MPTFGATAFPGILSSLDYAREGIDRGVASFEEVAQAVAGGVSNPLAVSAGNQVNALLARTQVAASAKAFETGDQVLGTLLDLRA